MEDRELPVDRETLYEEVWTEPVSVVAERYGLSGVGLAKACKRLSIPVPSRGYWEKVKAGRIMRKVPLPPLRESHATAARLIPLSKKKLAGRAAIREKVAKVKEDEQATVVPEVLADPHRLVVAAGKRLKQRDGWEKGALLRSAPAEVLHLEVTRDSLDRALRLMDVLMKSLEKAGINIYIDQKEGKTVLDSSGTQVSLSIVEQVTRSRHTPTAAEERARKRYFDAANRGMRYEFPRIPDFDFTATGRLTISVGRWRRRNWNDTGRTILEDRMDEVFRGIVTHIEELRAEDAEEVRRQQAHRIAVERYEQLRQRLESERKQTRELWRKAVRFRRSIELRQFISAFEARARAAGEPTAEQQSWIDWARAKADWLDPLIEVSDLILDAPKPRAPGYW